MTAGTNARISWVDVGKGVGIVLVTFGHLRNGSGESVWLPALDSTIDAIYLFHMPLFFFLGGFTLSNRRRLGDFLLQRIRTLIVPYYLFSVYFLAKPIAMLAIPSLSHELQAHEQDVWSVFYDVLIRGNGLWFLWAYFWGSLIGYLISKHVHRDSMRAGLGVLLILIYEAASLQWNIAQLPLQLGKGILAAGFILLGLGMKKVVLSVTRSHGVVLALVFCAAFGLSLAISGADPWGPLMSMILGVFMATSFSITVGNWGVLASIGRSSIVYYALNAVVLNFSKVLFFRLLAVDATEFDYLEQLVLGLSITAFSLVVLALLNRFVRRWFWWSIGAKKPVSAI